MLRVLCVAAIVSLVVGILKEGLEKGWMEGVTIWIAVFLVVAVGAGNNYMKEQQFAKLNAKRELRDVEVEYLDFFFTFLKKRQICHIDFSLYQIQVIRDGKPTTVSIYALTPGDLMIFNVGEIFPVDGILIRGSSILIDESSVTGESDLLEKRSYFELGNDILIIFIDCDI